MKHLLIVDDEHGSRESLRTVFDRDYAVSLAASADEALQCLEKDRVDLILLDVLMPEKDGLQFLKELQTMYPDMPVIMVSASTAVRPVVEAMRVGATDFVTKPFDVHEIRRTAARALESHALQRRVEVLQGEISREYPIDGIVGASLPFKRALQDARKAAESDAVVLIHGESGTGKELVARSIHAWSRRCEEPFVPVHCAGLPEQLLESELFGYEKGAFTGADKRKPGRFDLAGNGTLFFDEVSEMPMSVQVKLLRVLQEREFMRVGGTHVIRANARILAATGKDLRVEIRAGRFRDDLYYRLNVVPLQLPPLRERQEDIPLLAQSFLNALRSALNCRTAGFAPEAMQRLCAYTWPGNVRELRNIIERMLVLHGRHASVQAAFLPEEFGTHTAPEAAEPAECRNLSDAVSRYERRLIERALSESGGVQTAAAQRLGTTRRVLKYRMEKLDISPAAFQRETPPAGT